MFLTVNLYFLHLFYVRGLPGNMDSYGVSQGLTRLVRILGGLQPLEVRPQERSRANNRKETRKHTKRGRRKAAETQTKAAEEPPNPYSVRLNLTRPPIACQETPPELPANTQDPTANEALQVPVANFSNTIEIPEQHRQRSISKRSCEHRIVSLPGFGQRRTAPATCGADHDWMH